MFGRTCMHPLRHTCTHACTHGQGAQSGIPDELGRRCLECVCVYDCSVYMGLCLCQFECVCACVGLCVFFVSPEVSCFLSLCPSFCEHVHLFEFSRVCMCVH